MNEQHLTWWQRMKRMRRLSVTDDLSLRQLWSVRWNWLGVLLFLVGLFLLALAIMSALIIYTPARNLLPGYREDVRQQLVEASSRVDSLIADLQIQQQYVSVLKQVVAGDVETDSIQPLDSMQNILREQLLEAKNEATEEFIAQYEQKENDRFQLFDIQTTSSVHALVRPAEGVVSEPYSLNQGHPYITLLTASEARVCAVLAGTIVYETYSLDNTYSLVIQHEQYVSIYRRLQHLNKHVGDAVQTGEIIGVAADDHVLGFSLWRNGQSVNPEELIAF